MVFLATIMTLFPACERQYCSDDCSGWCGRGQGGGRGRGRDQDGPQPLPGNLNTFPDHAEMLYHSYKLISRNVKERFEIYLWVLSLSATMAVAADCKVMSL